MSTLLSRRAALALVLAAAASTALADDKDRYIVHEWGTFTSLQNDQGEALPGINIDDEPVPPFVHNLAPFLLSNPILSNEHWIYRQKGAPRQHPMVTMRLETPVLYFYPAPDGSLPEKVDVDVTFRGGWLTEFYPYAKASLPGLEDTGFNFGALSAQTRGTLTWNDVRLNTKQPGPETDEQVWVAPRKVRAVDVSVTNPGNGRQPEVEEHERYLFYRGVAHQDAPLRVATDPKKNELAIRANFADVLGSDSAEIRAAWLVDIRADGQAAYRTLPAFSVTGDATKVAATAARGFSEGDYATNNFATLKESMHKMLVADGLYEDEATAMLATWERAYFKTAGLRLFFLVPQVWSDHYLPVSISGRPSLTRVMMGRIELISDAQRALLPKVSQGESNAKWIDEIAEGDAKQRFLEGRSDFGDLGVKIPANYQAYLDLGRFRNALVIAEAQRAPSKKLEGFIAAYGIRPYKWAK